VADRFAACQLKISDISQRLRGLEERMQSLAAEISEVKVLYDLEMTTLAAARQKQKLAATEQCAVLEAWVPAPVADKVAAALDRLPCAYGLEDPAPELVKSGNIEGCELKFELYKDGTLYIKGTGPMSEFESNSGISTRQPWHDYIANASGITIKKLFVEDGVTSLSEGAFQGCINLETAEIATSVVVIPAKCFNRCAMLRTVRAKGVVEISDAAFQHCERLTTVTVNASLRVVGWCILRVCDAVERACRASCGQCRGVSAGQGKDGREHGGRACHLDGQRGLSCRP
jgi:hypothetical protein